MEILQVTGLAKTYGKDDAMVKALDDVIFTITKGEFVEVGGVISVLSTNSTTRRCVDETDGKAGVKPN